MMSEIEKVKERVMADPEIAMIRNRDDIESRMWKWSSIKRSGEDIPPTPGSFIKGYGVNFQDAGLIAGKRMMDAALKEIDLGRPLMDEERNASYDETAKRVLGEILRHGKDRMIHIPNTPEETLSPLNRFYMTLLGFPMKTRPDAKDYMGTFGHFADPTSKWHMARKVDADVLPGGRLYNQGENLADDLQKRYGGGPLRYWGLADRRNLQKEGGYMRVSPGGQEVGASPEEVKALRADPRVLEKERTARNMLLGQFEDAMRSGDPNVRRFADLLNRSRGWWQDTGFYSLYPVSYGDSIMVGAPDELITPSIGSKGGVFWHELTHAADRVSPRMDETMKDARWSGATMSSGLNGRKGLQDTMMEDFQDRFQGDTGRLLDEGERLYRVIQGSGPRRFADYYYPIQMLNMAHQTVTGGKEASGVLGVMDGHPSKGTEAWNAPGNKAREHMPSEAFVAMTNDYMTGNQTAKDSLADLFPKTKKRVGEMVGEARDTMDDYEDYLSGNKN